MKHGLKEKWIKLALLLTAAAAMWWLGRPQAPTAGQAKTEPPAMSSGAMQAMKEAAKLRAGEGKGAELPGEEVLAHYAAASTRPEDDLHAMAHAFSNLMLLAKGGSPFRMGANEEFAAALIGRNAAKIVFLAPPHPCLNGAGQIVDRWGTPLFFHVRDATHIDIRSAGPDRAMWTEDDLHRVHDGQFVQGAALPEPKAP